MSSGGGANYVEAWLARMRMRRQRDAPTLEEADRMRAEDCRDEVIGRFGALVITLVLLALAVIWE